MGCCDPEYRKTVLQMEEEVNKKGRDHIPTKVKIVVAAITLVVIASLLIF